MFKKFGILSICIFAVGCGGSSEPVLDDLDRLVAISEMLDNSFYLDETPIANMPISGSATYDGYAVILVGDAGQPAVDDYFDDDNFVLGDFQMTANFGTGAVDGEMTDFIGFGNRLEGQTFSGEISVNGAIDSAQGNLFEADYSGGLTDREGDTMYIDGELYGEFLGADAGTVVAESLEADNTATINGITPINAVVLVIGEN
ncbi:MAG: hypothetical protein JKX69_05930 [Rhodobacteraceae bacterium]|nr:hypothetical protein [Paracoccaceae bacterium]